MARGTLHLNVEFSAVTDEEGKFGRLATLLGLADAAHALGMCTRLWLACTRRGEAELPQWLVEQILGERGPDALVEAELASWAAGRGDSKTRRLRIGGAAKHCLWMSSSDDQAKREQRSKGGKSRASQSSRQLDGTFAPHPAEHPAPSSSSEISSEILPEDLSPARDPAVPSPAPAPEGQPNRPELPGRLEPETWTPNRIGDRDPKPENPIQQPPAPILPASIARADARRRVITTAWQLAGEAFRELGREGIDPTAPDAWAGLPGADSEAMKRLGAIADRLLVGDVPDADAAISAIRNRVAVAKAEARAKSPPTRRYLTPMAMWSPISFEHAAALSPEQIRADTPRAGPNGSAARAPEPVRKLKTL